MDCNARRSPSVAQPAAATAPWRAMPAHLVPIVRFDEPIDVTDARWKRDLELRAPNLPTFDVALLIDTTGDALSPEYRDRAGPCVAVLWQMLGESAPEKRTPYPPSPAGTRANAPKILRDPQQER